MQHRSEQFISALFYERESLIDDGLSVDVEGLGVQVERVPLVVAEEHAGDSWRLGVDDVPEQQEEQRRHYAALPVLTCNPL